MPFELSPFLSTPIYAWRHDLDHIKKSTFWFTWRYLKSEDTKLTISRTALFNTEVFLFCKLGCTKLNLGGGGWRDCKSWGLFHSLTKRRTRCGWTGGGKDSVNTKQTNVWGKRWYSKLTQQGWLAWWIGYSLDPINILSMLRHCWKGQQYSLELIPPSLKHSNSQFPQCA